MFSSSRREKHHGVTKKKAPSRSWSTGNVRQLLLTRNTNTKAFEILKQDSKYLLKLCQALQWENIEKCCKLLIAACSKKPAFATTTTTTGNKKSDDHDVSFIMARNQLLQTDNWGNTPLHVVCLHQPPPFVVKALIKASDRCCSSCSSSSSSLSSSSSSSITLPAAGEEASRPIIKLHTAVNKKGATPLIIACKTGACPEVIEMLLHGGPASAVMMHDRQGTTAFTGILNRYTMIQNIPAFQSRCINLQQQEGGGEEDNAMTIMTREDLYLNGDDKNSSKTTTTTTTKLWSNKYEKELSQKCPLGPMEFLSAQHHSRQQHQHQQESKKRNRNVQRKDAPIFPLFWNVIDNLMRTAWKDNDKDSNRNNNGGCSSSSSVKKNKGAAACSSEYISHLHGAAFVAGELPTEISDLILRTHKHDLLRTTSSSNNQSSSPDENENVQQQHPLDLAFSRRISSHPKIRQRHAHFVKRLLDIVIDEEEDEETASSSSNTATTTAPVARKRRSCVAASPSTFHQAIALGHYWNLEDDSTGPVQALFQSNPDVISTRNKETGLYPFMSSAAAATCGDDREDDDDTHRLGLNTIYNLLRASPDIIQQQQQ